MEVKMKKLMRLLICHIFLLGLMVIGGSSQFLQDKEYWCKFVKQDLTQCKKYPCIANICRKTCGKDLIKVTRPPFVCMIACPPGSHKVPPCKCVPNDWTLKNGRDKPSVIVQD